MALIFASVFVAFCVGFIAGWWYEVCRQDGTDDLNWQLVGKELELHDARQHLARQREQLKTANADRLQFADLLQWDRDHRRGAS